MEENQNNLQIIKLKTEFKVLPLALLDDPAKPVRTDLSPESVQELVVSMRQIGLVEPIVVKPVNGRFEVIAGHRRLVAATIIEMEKVPCYIIEADEQMSEMLKIHENLFRQEISPIDEGKFYDYLIQHYKLTPAKVSQMISKSYSYVMDRLQVLQYHQELRDALQKGEIKFSVAREFNRVTDVDTMLKFLYYATRSGITPALAKQWVDEWRAQQHPKNPAASAQTVPDPVTGEQYTTYVSCIFCKEQLKLFDAIPVYLHQKCLTEVNTPDAVTPTA